MATSNNMRDIAISRTIYDVMAGSLEAEQQVVLYGRLLPETTSHPEMTSGAFAWVKSRLQLAGNENCSIRTEIVNRGTSLGIDGVQYETIQGTESVIQTYHFRETDVQNASNIVLGSAGPNPMYDLNIMSKAITKAFVAYDITPSDEENGSFGSFGIIRLPGELSFHIIPVEHDQFAAVNGTSPVEEITLKAFPSITFELNECPTSTDYIFGRNANAWSRVFPSVARYATEMTEQFDQTTMDSMNRVVALLGECHKISQSKFLPT